LNTPGDKNRNRQRLLRKSQQRGTDYNARVWILKCELCENVYGSNSTDGWERKCPNCQNGRPGLDIPTERDGKDWTRDEHIIAFHRYNRIEFGKIHTGNPEVVELAALLGRKVGSAALKLTNFARLDPTLQARHIKGMSHGSKGEADVWEEFTDHPELLVIESTRLLAALLGSNVEDLVEIKVTELPPPGREREALVKLRVNQTFFRDRVLSAYGFRCCVTGLAHKELLNASHIVGWARDEKNRLNPRNGLCLNALHDRAFDRCLMWIDRDFKVRFAPLLRRGLSDSNQSLAWLLSFEGEPLLLPSGFRPDPELLAQHASRALETADSE